MNRYRSIDVARVLAIFMMFVCHFIAFLSPSEGTFPNLYFFGDSLIGAEVAPLFIFVVGMSFCLSVTKREDCSSFSNKVTWRSLKRGLVVFIFGLIFAQIVWGNDYLWGWDILPLIGSSIILLTFIRKFKTRDLIIIGVIIVLAAPLLRAWFEFPRFWKGDDYSPPITLLHTLGGYFLNGYFPFFPWMAYPIFGFAVSKATLTEGDEDRKARSRDLLPFIAAILIAFGLGGALLGNYWNMDGVNSLVLNELSFYPLTTSLFLAELGFCLIVFWFLHVTLDFKASTDDRIHTFFNRYSRYALSAYVIHLLVVVFIPRMVAMAFRGDDYFYYENIVSSPVALLSSIAFFFILYFVFSMWDRVGGKFSFEWIIGRIT